MVLLRKFDPELHHRRSIRLKEYNYSRPGFYFFTLCTKYREPLFGEIENNTVILSPYGKIVEATWFDLPNHNPNIILDAFVIMPDHFHGIIQIKKPDRTENYSGFQVQGLNDPDNLVGTGSEPAPTKDSLSEPAPTLDSASKTAPFREPKRQPLSEIIRQLKTFSARRINEILNTPGISVWQRDYYESIVRDPVILEKTRRYILTNPLRSERQTD